jgi:hypothetical protein
MSDEEFMTKYAQHKAKFIVFNKPKLYIEASVKINAKEFERKFYMMMYEDMVKLRAIWVACSKPNPEVRMLWYSEADQKKWRTYAKKRELDPNTDVCVEQKTMERL